MIRSILKVFFVLHVFDLNCKQLLKLKNKKTNYVSIDKPNVFANKYELTNEEYHIYLEWIKTNRGEEFYLNGRPSLTIANNSNAHRMFEKK